MALTAGKVIPLSYLREDLRHVRLVHISLIAVSFTIIYLVLSHWVDAPELVQELKQLEACVANFREGKIDPQAVGPQLQSLLWDSAVTTEEALTQEVGLRWAQSHQIAPIFWVDVPQPNPFSNANTVEEIQRAAAQFHFIVKVPTTFRLVDLKQLGPFESATSGTPIVRTIGLVALESPGSVRLTVSTHHVDLGAPESPTGTTVLIDQRSFVVHCDLQAKDFALGGTWFDSRFPHTSRRVGEVRRKSVKEAIVWSEEQRLLPLEKTKIVFLKLEIEGSHAGYVGMTLLTVLLFYLLSLLANISIAKSRKVRSEMDLIHVGGVSPWIGAMDAWSARILSWASLGLVPPTAVFLAVWRLVGKSEGTSAMAAILSLIIGIRCAWLGNEIRELQAPATNERGGEHGSDEDEYGPGTISTQHRRGSSVF